MRHNHQSSHARPDEIMSTDERGWDEKPIGSNVKSEVKMTGPQRGWVKHIAAKKRRQRDVVRLP